jgi:hypothetical protein
MVLVGLAAATPARGQVEERIYAGALVGTYDTNADHVSGTLASVGVAVGVRVLPWLDIEVDLLKPNGHVIRDYTGRSVSFTGPGPPETFVLTHFVNERRPDIVISAGVAFHPRVAWRRVTPRVFVGVSNHRVRDRTVLEHLYLPPGVTLEQVNRAMPPEDWRTRNLGGPTIGGSVDFAITKRISVAPDIRYDYGSIGDEINNMLRGSLRIFWHF